MAENDSVATAAAFVSALVARLVPFMMNGKNVPTARLMNSTTLEVTRVTCQEYVKATMMAAMIQAPNSRNVPSFSEIPTCKVLASLVIVPAAAPGGIMSMT